MTDPTTITGTVYVLIDPRDNRIRYVGATTKTLNARMQGHKARAASRVKAWIDALAAEGLAPLIEPISEGVPEAQLRDREREEITRRLLAGESLLNEAATVQGRKLLQRRRQDERIERERAAWEHAANQVRSILGGPITPGDVTPIPLSPQVVADYHSLLRAREEPDKPVLNKDGQLTKETRILLARSKASDALWLSVQGVWGRLQGRASQRFEGILASRVGAIFDETWTDLEDASQYLALLPWGMMAVGPWAALAERAGMDAAGSEFIEWVSDDPNVREALNVLLVRAGGRMGPLSTLDNVNNLSRPSTGLVAMAAAHSPRFDLPPALHMEVASFLESILQDRLLTPGMGDLFNKLDPHALDRLLGPNIAADTDAQLGLPPGTSRDVLVAVLQKSKALRMDRLDRIVSRARGAFPTVETPDFREFSGTTVPMFQAITVSLAVSGLIPPPSGKTPSQLVDELRTLWRGDLSRLEQAA